jgi:hypothetical protein
VTHIFKRILILAVCCVAIATLPAAADTLANYLGTVSQSGQDLSYAQGINTFTNGNLIFQFTGLTITPTCTDSVSLLQVNCALGSYNPVSANAIQIIGTQGINSYAGFDLTGQMDVNSYTANNGDQIAVNEDINLNYTVSTNNGAATISDAHLDVSGCVTDPAASAQFQGPGGCLSNGNGLPPKLRVIENWAGTNQSITVSAPPPILNQFVNFLPNTYSTLQVTKDIFMDAGACSGCSVSFSDLKQYYSQVPEPRSFAWILGLGMLGLAQVRRRLTAKA